MPKTGMWMLNEVTYSRRVYSHDTRLYQNYQCTGHLILKTFPSPLPCFFSYTFHFLFFFCLQSGVCDHSKQVGNSMIVLTYFHLQLNYYLLIIKYMDKCSDRPFNTDKASIHPSKWCKRWFFFFLTVVDLCKLYHNLFVFCRMFRP